MRFRNDVLNFPQFLVLKIFKQVDCNKGIWSFCYSIIMYYTHTEKYSPKRYVVNFHTQISSSQSEYRTMVFLAQKMICPIRITNNVFSFMRKMIRPIRSHRGVWVSCQNSCLISLAAPLHRHSMKKVYLKEFFS